MSSFLILSSWKKKISSDRNGAGTEAVISDEEDFTEIKNETIKDEPLEMDDLEDSTNAEAFFEQSTVFLDDLA